MEGSLEDSLQVSVSPHQRVVPVGPVCEDDSKLVIGKLCLRISIHVVNIQLTTRSDLLETAPHGTCVSVLRSQQPRPTTSAAEVLECWCRARSMYV